MRLIAIMEAITTTTIIVEIPQYNVAWLTYTKGSRPNRTIARKLSCLAIKFATGGEYT
jgi:hypothetical protein